MLNTQHLSMQTDIILFLNPEYIINDHHLASEKYLNLDDGSLTNSLPNCLISQLTKNQKNTEKFN